MAVEGLIDRAVENIADGQAVNWDLLDSQAQDDDERKQLKMLRILEEIAQLHRSTQDSDADESFGATRSSTESSVGSIDELAEDAARAAASTAPALAHAGVTTHAPQQAAVETWGRYHLLEKVGEGSFGSVYRAWDPQLEREIALKILHRQLTDDRLRDKLLREGRALARVRQSSRARSAPAKPCSSAKTCAARWPPFTTPASCIAT
jgi:hypothetical protein